MGELVDVVANWPFWLLTSAGIVAGIINVLAGGGSFLTLPALMLFGLPADVANGTNRVGVLSQSIVATIGYRQNQALPGRELARVLAPMLAGAVVGSWLATLTPEWLLRPVLLGTLIAIAALIAFKDDLFPARGEGAPLAPGKRATFGLVLCGLYGGYVQAGVGFLVLGVLGGLMRYEYIAANAVKIISLLVFGSISLAIFVAAGDVRWVPGIALAVGTSIGARIGVRLSFKLNDKTLRRFLFVCVVVACVAAWLRG